MKESRIIKGFMSILDLKNSRMSVNRVMALLELPEIKEKFGISESEIEILERWIKKTNIRIDENSESEVQILRSILDDMSKKEELSGFDKSIKIEVVKFYLGGHFSSASSIFTGIFYKQQQVVQLLLREFYRKHKNV